QTLIFIHKGEVDYLIQYGTGYMFALTVSNFLIIINTDNLLLQFVCVIIFGQKTSKAVRNLTQDLEVLNFESVIPVKDKIRKSTNQATILILVHMLVAFLACISAILPKESDKELYFFIPWLKFVPSMFQKILEYCMRLQILVGGMTLNMFP